MNANLFSSRVFWILVCLASVNGTGYRCGIRKHSFKELINHGWKVEEGQWPWHVAILHKSQNETSYACGGSLIDERHVMTAAHCVVDRKTKSAMSAGDILLHFGQTNLSKTEKHLQVRDVTTVHVHPEYSKNRNDIAVLKVRLPLEFTDLVIPICLDTTVHRDLRDMEGQRGYITGWGLTQNGTVSEELQSASLPVVNLTQCLQDDWKFFGGVLNPNVFCAGDRNGTSPGTGDSGGGMYFSEGDRWVLRGIVSFAKLTKNRLQVDTSKYAVFTNVQRFLSWIREVTDDRGGNSTKAGEAKRISEKECDRFKSFVQRFNDGTCINNRYTHMVSILVENGIHYCNGILLNENHVLTTCYCARNEQVESIRIGESNFNISTIICHPEYDNKLYYNNVAVIELESPVKLSHKLIPACLASNWTENLYDTLLTTGFRHSLSFQRGPILSTNSVKVPDTLEFFESNANEVLAAHQCNPPFRMELRQNQLCITNNDRPSTVWRLNTIGTALQTSNTRTCLSTVVGQLSFDYNDYDKAIFNRVAHHLSWIEDTVWGVPAAAAGPEMASSDLEDQIGITKRISEKECDRFQSLARKSSDGNCLNTWNSGRVNLINRLGLNVCSGILLNENQVLTTCSCVRANKPPVAAQISNLDTVNISSSICHPAYNYSTGYGYHDIAIVRLVSAVQLSHQLIPACLASNWREIPNDTLMIVDYLSEFESDAIEVKIGANQLLTPEECNRNVWIASRGFPIDPTQLCVISNGTLLRNHGASLQIANNQTCLGTAVAVLGQAFKRTSKRDTHLLLFSRLDPYLDWIEEIVWGEKAVLKTTATTLKEPTMTEQTTSTKRNWAEGEIGENHTTSTSSRYQPLVRTRKPKP